MGTFRDNPFRQASLTSRSVPAKVAPRRLQFFSFAFFKVATRRLMPVIWLPSMSTPFRLAPNHRNICLRHDDKCGTATSLCKICNGLPSRLAFNPEGSSKLHPLRDAPSALEQSIFTPCRLAPFDKQNQTTAFIMFHHYKSDITPHKKVLLSPQTETQTVCLLFS